MKNKIFAGFLQATGVAVYCGAIAFILQTADKFAGPLTPVSGTALMLILLVVSAAITGSLVFGYPVFLICNRRVKEGLLVFGSTLFWLGFFVISVLVCLSANRAV
jgi:hypothetical protein